MNALIIGRRRQGKSTLALRLCQSYHRTVIVFDPNAQFTSASTILTDAEELSSWLADDSIPHDIAVIRPHPGSIDEEFAELVEVVWPLGNYALLLDESSCLQRPNHIHPELERLMRQAPRDGALNADGRSVDVSVVQTTHRPVDVNSLCRALATDTFLSQMQLRRDLDVVTAQWGEEVAAELPRLPRFNAVHVYTDLDGRQKYSIWNEPDKWYSPIGIAA